MQLPSLVILVSSLTLKNVLSTVLRDSLAVSQLPFQIISDNITQQSPYCFFSMDDSSINIGDPVDNSCKFNNLPGAQLFANVFHFAPLNKYDIFGLGNIFMKASDSNAYAQQVDFKTINPSVYNGKINASAGYGYYIKDLSSKAPNFLLQSSIDNPIKIKFSDICFIQGDQHACLVDPFVTTSDFNDIESSNSIHKRDNGAAGSFIPRARIETIVLTDENTAPYEGPKLFKRDSLFQMNCLDPSSSNNPTYPVDPGQNFTISEDCSGDSTFTKRDLQGQCNIISQKIYARAIAIASKWKSIMQQEISSNKTPEEAKSLAQQRASEVCVRAPQYVLGNKITAKFNCDMGSDYLMKRKSQDLATIGSDWTKKKPLFGKLQGITFGSYSFRPCTQKQGDLQIKANFEYQMTLTSPDGKTLIATDKVNLHVYCV